MTWLLENIASLAVGALNAIIAALGAALAAALALLPDMPDLPERPGAFDTAYGWVAWGFPVNTVWDILVFCAARWLLWQLVAIALRWAKALSA
jgi:hypothetical protein